MRPPAPVASDRRETCLLCSKADLGVTAMRTSSNAEERQKNWSRLFLPTDGCRQIVARLRYFHVTPAEFDSCKQVESCLQSHDQSSGSVPGPLFARDEVERRRPGRARPDGLGGPASPDRLRWAGAACRLFSIIFFSQPTVVLLLLLILTSRTKCGKIGRCR